MTKLEIINNALMKCGLPLAASLADADYNALHVYEMCVAQALEAHHWSFARRYACPEELENDHAFGLAYCFRLPPDVVTIIDVRSQESPNAPVGQHERIGDRLYFNSRPCYARYTARVDESVWPASFANAVSSCIAYQIAGLSAEKMALVPQLMQLYNLHLSLAQAADAKETRHHMPGGSAFMDARSQAKSG